MSESAFRRAGSARFRGVGTFLIEHPLRLPILLMFFLIGSKGSAQTSVVVFRTDTAIFAAADSKSDPTDRSRPTVMCKFFKTADLYYGISGVYFDEYPNVVSQSGISLATIRSGTRRFEQIISPILQDAFERLRAEYPARYEHFMHVEKPGIDFIFFGMKKTVPVVATVGFRLEESEKSVKVTVGRTEFLDGPHCPGGNVICGALSGFNKAILAYQSRNPDWWRTNNRASLVKKFVQLEIDAEPANVGPPISVLQIDAKGARWIQNGVGCAD